MTVRFGLIGCGFISSKHIQALASCEEAKLAAVSDLQEARMEEMKQYYLTMSGQEDLVKSYQDYQELLKDSTVDAVIITSSSGLHAIMAKAALLANKHVVLEKPMALSIEDSNELVAMAVQQQRELMVCHQLRFRPIMQTIKGIIDSGKLGSLYLGVASLRINRTLDYYTSTAWRGKWASDGGMLINQGIHVIDLLQWFLGDVQTVYGEIGHFSQVKETEDVALGIIHFQNQAMGMIEANIVTKPANMGYSLSIFGEKGTIVLNGPSLNQISRWHIEGEDTKLEELEQLLENRMEQVYMYENFIEAVKSENKHVLIDGSEGKKALEIIFSIYQSYLAKQTMSYPFPSFSTSDMNRKEESES